MYMYIVFIKYLVYFDFYSVDFLFYYYLEILVIKIGLGYFFCFEMMKVNLF